MRASARWRSGSSSSRPVTCDEHRVGVAVEHAHALLGEGVARPAQRLLAEAGDRVRDVGVEEAARGGAEHAEERVQHDLDRLRGVHVAALARRGARVPEALDDARQDPAAAREARAVRRFERVAPSRRDRTRQRVRERIEIEGADQARVQALEVEDRDVAVEAGNRIEQRPARTPALARAESTLGATKPRRRSSGR